MDGRVQEPVSSFGREKFGGQFGDTITEAGLVGVLSQEKVDDKLLKSLKSKIEISMEKHHSKGIIVHGHAECAGNPVDDEKHKDDVRRSVDVIKSLIDSSIPVVGVFVKRSPEDPTKWIVEEIPQTVTG
ncbi:MAG: hypothetical protein Q7K55_02695 [Candidatus Levybacteria bacterium]|nr:hypothetical protein [Candidatus Levybacteria bacterium]